MANNTNMQPFPTQSANEAMPRPCTAQAYSRNGRKIGGTAAFLKNSSAHGGVDAYVAKQAMVLAKEMVKEMLPTIIDMVESHLQENTTQSKLKKVA